MPTRRLPATSGQIHEPAGTTLPLAHYQGKVAQVTIYELEFLTDSTFQIDIKQNGSNEITGFMSDDLSVAMRDAKKRLTGPVLRDAEHCIALAARAKTPQHFGPARRMKRPSGPSM